MQIIICSEQFLVLSVAIQPVLFSFLALFFLQIVAIYEDFTCNDHDMVV